MRWSPGRTTTPADDLARQAGKTPEATALSWDGGAWSYAELHDRAEALADRLEALCVVPGQAATLYSPPTSQTVATLFALWRAGCVAMPLHERLTPAEVDHARSFVVSGLHIDNFTFLIRDESGGYDRFPDVIAFILTSGSSGAPRAVGFTRAAFAASAAAAASRLELTAADRWGLCLSLGHIGGLSLVVRAVMTGSSVRLWPSFDAVAVARAVLAGEVTHLAVVPVMLRRLLTRLAGRPIPPTLRCVLVGGAAAPRALLDEAWAAGLPLATTWGMTETASQVATAPPSLARRHPGTAGRPLRCVEVRAGASH
ncbi:MAG: 2-succinylbenzoate--CoA ligase, partial [Gemmatimonadetes bacterium]|nr:2-succinylbenzoate--CoA ligase [Gemmatimonadota bacterium]